MAIEQHCVSCDDLVAKFKDGVEWKIYKAHRALDDNNSVDSTVPALCDECFSPSNKQFKDAKHYNDQGKWIGPKARMIQSTEDDIKSLEERLNAKKKKLERVKEFAEDG